MPRSNRPRSHGAARKRAGAGRGAKPEPQELDVDRVFAGAARVESAGDGEWMVRQISAAQARKEYLCPGCGNKVLTGSPHLVVWREDWIFGEADAIAGRRHWHTACWRGRSYRSR
ncbi:ATP/GTP-binding protein [Arthrobacter russicus]|jgi:hypothetical protein|uniref:ATP/GTP-binding protein n=1 Tax=Arthrobacter russicus TaxID=172040 RepID=A0ABU1J8E2_9MICC|nr:ATP/GTP-binding protein [Arthrobacter russicus]MDR6268405.1 hypothetical protein [Arthrobacter russicus]